MGISDNIWCSNGSVLKWGPCRRILTEIRQIETQVETFTHFPIGAIKQCILYVNETKYVGMWSQVSCFFIGIFPFKAGNGGEVSFARHMRRGDYNQR